MKNNLHKLILATVVLLIGIFGTFLIKYLPANVIGVLFLIFLGIFRFGGLFLFIVYLIRVFSKERIENSTLEEKIIKRNKTLTHSIVFLVFGLLFCCSTLLTPFLCDKNDNICAIQSIGIDVLFFVPIGVILIGTGLLKLYRFLQTNVES
jgi:hypothetical protein